MKEVSKETSFQISSNTLNMLDKSIQSMREGKVSDAINTALEVEFANDRTTSCGKSIYCSLEESIKKAPIV